MAGQPATFDDGIEQIGFHLAGRSRRGGRMWTLEFNRYLTFTLHDYDDYVVLTWSLNLGEFVQTRGMQIGAGETSFQELYPQRDIKLSLDADAVRTEITRTLGLLRFDFATPDL